MQTQLNDPGPARVTPDFVVQAAAGAESAVPADTGPKDYMDDRTARRLGRRLIGIGAGLLAAGMAVGTFAAGTAMAAPVTVLTLMAGATATTMGVTLRFPGSFGSWIKDKRPPEARN
ncbi:MAG: hypothetical protein AAFX94_12550 [Myxococcota bacterium]